MTVLVVRGGTQVSGSVVGPGDTSISHRALMLAATARGTSRLSELAPGEDVASTASCLRRFGVDIDARGSSATVGSPGLAGWKEPQGPLDCGNSGTTMRLLAGLAARLPHEIVLDGDRSLRGRPMERVASPLREMGADVRTDSGRPPVRVRGGRLTAAHVRSDVASAQVKSAVLLAGLGSRGTTVFEEPQRSRDHTERMLSALGAPVRVDGPVVKVEEFEVPPFDMRAPGDPSSAAFLAAAACLSGEIRIEAVGLNPTRLGFVEWLERAGARIRWEQSEETMGEPIGWLECRQSELSALPSPDAARMIDELPLAAVVATQAQGETRITGAAELRVKESDRISAVCRGLSALGADVSELHDGLVVRGPTRLRGATVDSHGDHRLAMAMAVAGLVADGTTVVTGFEAASVSWPGFADALRDLGADVAEQDSR
ncbi:MAG TPA: 3-phosphoshikimate 1-carboxyvinyltransferase [Actinomycetota bacterium]|nr:3-phosphoshikimate 1-carboxyvinyltransferase [Actinomycetota bacterium]